MRMISIRGRLGRVASWYLYRVRGYAEGEYYRIGWRACLDPFFAALLAWGGCFRIAPFRPLLRSMYRQQRENARTGRGARA
jgi:hypothetical protein